MTTQSDYDAIGGGSAVSTVVENFYTAVLADESLAPFFAEVEDMGRLKRHQVALVSQVLGGPVVYEGRSLAEAHAGLNVTSEAFTRVAVHLITEMREAGVPAEILARVGTVLGATKSDIVTA